MNEQQIKNFDIKKYLDSQNIYFIESGKNVGEGAIGICCPSCDDTNYHLGIDIDSKLYNCWRCEEQGNLVSLMVLIEGISYEEARNKIRENITLESDRTDFEEKVKHIFEKTIEEDVEEIKKGRLAVPCTKYVNELQDEFSMDKVFLKFIEKRGHTIEELSKWGVRVEFFNDFAYRLMFPITYRGKIVNYLGRTVINSNKKYKNCSNENAIITTSKLLYGYDYIREGQNDLVVCEGVFDVIRFGQGIAVGLFGKSISVEQMELICSLRIKNRIMIMLDGDAMDNATRISKELRPLVHCEVQVIILDDNKDPDSYSREELLEIIK